MKHASTNFKSERGSATLVALALLLVVISLVVSNSLVLHHLSTELRLIERQQKEKFGGQKK